MVLFLPTSAMLERNWELDLFILILMIRAQSWFSVHGTNLISHHDEEKNTTFYTVLLNHPAAEKEVEWCNHSAPVWWSACSNAELLWKPRLLSLLLLSPDRFWPFWQRKQMQSPVVKVNRHHKAGQLVVKRSSYGWFNFFSCSHWWADVSMCSTALAGFKSLIELIVDWFETFVFQPRSCVNHYWLNVLAELWQ